MTTKRFGNYVVRSNGDLQHVSGIYVRFGQLRDVEIIDGTQVLRQLIRLARIRDFNDDLIEAYRFALGKPPDKDLWQGSIALVRHLSSKPPAYAVQNRKLNSNP